ncbi:MAG: hypothetical protein LBJ73_02440 [Rickettsiales bacterium]|jgi:hypothetical protein|nr:hypothetical protein [Rickettsiales bacterium]
MSSKKIFLGASLFLTTFGNLTSQDAVSSAADSLSGPGSDVAVTAAGVRCAEIEQRRDTIWEYGYPVFERPLVVLNNDGEITFLSCSGLVYENISHAEMYSWSDSKKLRIHYHTDMWQAARADISKRLGIQDKKAVDLLIVQTLAYHEKKKSVAEKNSIAGIDWRDRPSKESLYIGRFEEKLARKQWGLNSRGRIAHIMYLRKRNGR